MYGRILPSFEIYFTVRIRGSIFLLILRYIYVLSEKFPLFEIRYGTVPVQVPYRTVRFGAILYRYRTVQYRTVPYIKINDSRECINFAGS
jgi:hypothetical protein